MNLRTRWEQGKFLMARSLAGISGKRRCKSSIAGGRLAGGASVDGWTPGDEVVLVTDCRVEGEVLFRSAIDSWKY